MGAAPDGAVEFPVVLSRAGHAQELQAISKARKKDGAAVLEGSWPARNIVPELLLQVPHRLFAMQS